MSAPRPPRFDRHDPDDRSRRSEPQAGAEGGRRIAEALRAGRRVAMFLDYDGTLREIEADPAAAAPTPAVRAVLDALAREGRADVTIISGRTQQDLEAFVGGYPFGLIAEHGATVRRPRSREWEHLDRGLSYPWLAEAREVLREYSGSLPGSFVEEKRTSLVWHYRRADAAAGERSATHLAGRLAPLAAQYSLNVRHGKKIVEVTASEVNKGAAVTRLLHDPHRPYDLVVVAGDDLTDASMFALDVPDLISIQVGWGDTRARYQLPDPAALRGFLTSALSDE